MVDNTPQTQSPVQATMGAVSQQVQKSATLYAATRPLKEKATEITGDLLRKTDLGKEALGDAADKSFRETREAFLKRVQKNTFDAIAEKTGSNIVAKAASGGAKIVAKSATRIAPGIGAVAAGAYAAVDIHQDKKEMKNQYAGIISNFFKKIGQMIAPHEVEYKHVKKYAEANTIVGGEIKDMWRDARKEVGYGALGFAGTAIQIGEEAYNAYQQNYSTAEWVDILNDYKKAGGAAEAGHVLLLVESAYQNDPNQALDNLSEAQWQARQEVAAVCADKINSGQMSYTDMVAFIGEGAFLEQANNMCLGGPVRARGNERYCRPISRCRGAANCRYG
jgi:hypothetical protein